MARAPSLKPQLNQIRTWVAEGVTDIWIAHQLGVTPAQIADFRRKQGLLRPDETPAPAKPRAPRAAAEPRAAAKPRSPRAPKAEPAAEGEASTADESDITGGTDEDGAPKRRRRGRRGGRGRGKSRTQTIPATIEHSEDGIVIRIDVAILTSETYREHWAEVTAGGITVTAEGIALSSVAPASEADQTDDDSDDAVDHTDAE
jgi:hypothetical protein